MPAKNQDIEMYVDADLDLEFIFDPTDVADLSSANIVWEMSATVDGEAILTKTNADMTIAANKFTVYINPSDNVGLEPGSYFHEARVTDINNNSRPVALGKVTLIDTITSS